jgi:glycosyltransferase involved in cell wall biosynthesis
MKICQVLCSRGNGGLERHFVDLCNGLARGNQVVAIAHPEFGGRLDPAITFEPLDLCRGRLNPMALLGLRAVLKKYRPDVVHAQANKAASMVMRATWGMRMPRVATVHNLKKNNRMYRGYDRLIAVSKTVADHVLHPDKRVIFNGISQPGGDVDAVSVRRELGVPDGKLWLLCAVRLVSAKGLDVLVRAWSGMDRDAYLVIAGDGPERGHLEQLIGELGLQESICLAGYRNDIPRLLQACDGLVISSYREGFPYAMVEALMAGKPVLSTTVPGAREWLPASCLVGPGDPQALASMISNNVGDWPSTLAAFRPVWARAQQELSVDAMVNATAQVYRELVPG